MRRWLALAVLAGSQLLIVLDATIVNVALTDIRSDLALELAELQWVVTGYVLAFGGFLLLGGRLADRYGRRRMFIAGATVFGVGSLLAGLAASAAVLFTGRALQGLGAAVLAPAALSLVMTIFPDGRDRNRALAIWGAVSAGGTAFGMILGGVLTQALSWQWIFWINLPIVTIAVVAARRLLPEAQTRRTERFDVAGALLGTVGLACLVYSLVEGAEAGWASARVLPVLVVATLLLGVFARLQAVRPHSLVPIRLLRNRVILGADILGLLLGAVTYALFYFLSLFMGHILGYGAIAVGFAFLPMAIAIAAASAGAASLLPRLGHRPILVASVLLITVALAGLGRIDPMSSYLGTMLPSLVLAGVGLGLAFVALTAAAVGSAPTRDSGIAAALFNAGQQIGAALGLAVLTAASSARAAGVAAGGGLTPEAITHGWSLAFVTAAGIMVTGLLIIATMIKPGRRDLALAR